MYEFLNLDWKELSMSDYSYKRNTPRRIMELNAADLPDGQSAVLDSSILIFYNLYTNQPMVMVEKVMGCTNLPAESEIVSLLDDKVRENFNVACHLYEKTECVEIVLTRKDLYEAILQQEDEQD